MAYTGTPIQRARLIDLCLLMGGIPNAQQEFKELVTMLAGYSLSEMLVMVREEQITSHSTAWLLKAWCRAKEIDHPVWEFETAYAFCGAGEMRNYRLTKKTWGHLINIFDDKEHDTRTFGPGDGHLRIFHIMKSNSPIRLRMTTRNELKCFLGNGVVELAMRWKQADFLRFITPADQARAERITGYPIKKLWTSIRNGDEELLKKLGEFHNAKREAMRKGNRFTNSHALHQGELF